mmetsp:Transcript_49266/g.107473  ORF Transcript_49266/g.107473 Transcript_49266/m.107473 type:complete len:253 (+) Transcript_49266:227-985(+)
MDKTRARSLQKHRSHGVQTLQFYSHFAMLGPGMPPVDHHLAIHQHLGPVVALVRKCIMPSIEPKHAHSPHGKSRRPSPQLRGTRCGPVKAEPAMLVLPGSQGGLAGAGAVVLEVTVCEILDLPGPLAALDLGHHPQLKHRRPLGVAHLHLHMCQPPGALQKICVEHLAGRLPAVQDLGPIDLKPGSPAPQNREAKVLSLQRHVAQGSYGEPGGLSVQLRHSCRAPLQVQRQLLGVDRGTARSNMLLKIGLGK